MRKTLLTALVAALLLPLGAAAQRKLMPRDDAPHAPSFLEFRRQLKEAVSRRDSTFVRKIVEPDTKLGFGGEHGLNDFEEMWQLEDPKSRFWEELRRILELGGAGNDEVFTAPYVFTDWPADVDPFEHVAVRFGKIVLRMEPRVEAAVIPKLISYEIVRVIEEPADANDWLRVATEDGHEGYLRKGSIRSPLDYRARFERREGRWVMTFFMAGD